MEQRTCSVREKRQDTDNNNELVIARFKDENYEDKTVKTKNIYITFVWK